jgi:hypothetical protein
MLRSTIWQHLMSPDGLTTNRSYAAMAEAMTSSWQPVYRIRLRNSSLRRLRWRGKGFAGSDQKRFGASAPRGSGGAGWRRGEGCTNPRLARPARSFLGIVEDMFVADLGQEQSA